MHTYLLDMLACPVCHRDLTWHIDEQNADRIEAAEARCSECAATYPVREGIGLFLTPDLPRDDLWEQAGSGLTQHLQAHPELERQLMDVPPETLAPADQFFRALVLEEQGDYVAAQRIENLANQGLYTPEYTAGKNSQLDYAERLSRVGVPTLAIMGTQDPDFPSPAEEGQFIAEQTRGRLELIEGAGHYPQTEMPQQTTALVIEFLKQAVPAPVHNHL